MTIELITPEEHAKLLEIQKESPKLTFQNVGYEYINMKTLSEQDLENYKIVTDILSKSVKGFSKFNNFKLDKEQQIHIRLQYDWSYGTGDLPFTGVGYLKLDELLNGFDESEVKPKDIQG